MRQLLLLIVSPDQALRAITLAMPCIRSHEGLAGSPTALLLS